jgi:hypothetical protein
MKILKKGRGQKGWTKEFTCTGKGNGGGGCGAVLLVELGDLFQTSSSDYGGDTDYYVTFKCCQCGVKTDIPDSVSPKRAIELPLRPKKKTESAK